MRSIVIGAGYAGLAAATRLAAAGRDVTVLEARARVGGRAWSQSLGNGVIVERGAEYIFPVEHAVRALAAEYRVPIVSHGVTYERRSLDGRRIGWQELVATEERVREAARSLVAQHPEATAEDAFAAVLGDGFPRNAYYRRLATSVAADLSQVSAHALGGSEAAVLIDDGGRLRGGNQALAQAMAASLGAGVRLSSPVVAVELRSSSVTVVTASRERFIADELVIAVPLPLIGDLGLGFTLPSTIVRALAMRATGDATKCAVGLSQDVDDVAVQSATEFSWSWQSQDDSGSARVPALVGFTGGASAARYAVPDGGRIWLADVRTLRGSLEVTEAPLVTAWKEDPWARGAYSHARPGWDPRDVGAFDELIGGRVAFAGEYISTAASLDGAASSGIAAAHRLLRGNRPMGSS